MSPIEEMQARYGASYKWLATGTVMLGTIVVTVAATIVNVALNDIMGTFGMSQDQVQWLSTGFLAAMTATMLLTAWQLDRFGHRTTYIFALTLFIVGSLLGAVSHSSGEVILARVLQGLAAGMIQPMAMVVISIVFPYDKRGTAMGIYGMGVVLAPALGPTLGGVMVDEYSWRDVFLVVLPICAVAIAAAAAFLPGRDPHIVERKRFDVIGFALLSVALVTLLYGLSNGQRLGWHSNEILLSFTFAILSSLGFIIWELISPNALLNMRVFTSIRFSASCVVAFALGAGIYGSTYIIPLFVQTIQGYTPTRSGLLLMPAGLILLFIFPVAGRVSDRVPARIPISGGLILFGFSFWLATAMDVNTPFWTLAWWVVLGRIGLGFILPALNAGALRALPDSQLAQGSGSVNFVRQLGGAFGVNLLAIFVERRTTFHGDALAQTLTAANPAAAETLRRLNGMLAHWGNPFGDRFPQHLHPAALSFLEAEVVPKAQMLAYQDGFYIVAILFFLAVIPAWLMNDHPLGKRRPRLRTAPSLSDQRSS